MTPEQAQHWQTQTPWLVGANFVPSNAINQLEMWQAKTWSPEVIDRELGWAANIGMNCMRVFLHDLLWTHDREGFLTRLDAYLEIADKHQIKTMFVFFDSVWHPQPRLGAQRAPEPHVHNSGWVQSPGIHTLRHPELFAQLEPYVMGVIERYRHDPRVVAWDLWNEPENDNPPSYGSRDIVRSEKDKLVAPLLEQVFAWARAANPSQPITSGVWLSDLELSNLRPVERVQLEHSDIISFHVYADAAKTLALLEKLEQLERPLICTEYMARPVGSSFEAILPIFKKHHVGAINWGLVAGKTQTNYPWDSWQKRYDAAPELWFHEVFHASGTPYSQAEVDTIRTLTL
jgi:Cellulase (glycosyl hydrolase family 5)